MFWSKTSKIGACSGFLELKHRPWSVSDTRIPDIRKSPPPRAFAPQSNNDSPARLRLPNITLPLFTGKENLNRFIEQLTSVTQVLGHLFKATNPKGARVYDALVEAEKQHKHLLGATPDKASPAEFGKYFDLTNQTR